MKPTLALKMSQQLTMTPQLQQAIKLLQLSTLDLQQEVQQALESNPMLEVDDGQIAADENDKRDLESNVNSPSNDPTKPEEPQVAEDTKHSTEQEVMAESSWDENIPNELPVDTAWEDVYQSSAPASSGSGGEEFDFTARTASEESLQDHLTWQLNLTHMSETDQFIAVAIIDAVDNSGYLSCDLETLHQGFDAELDIELDEVVAVQRRLQHFDPVGVASQNLSECLSVQLKLLDKTTPGFNCALKITHEYLDLLGNHDYAQLMRKLKVKEPELKLAVELIQELDPRPGSMIGDNSSDYVIPDVIVRKTEEHWVVELNQDAAPKVRINNSYASLIKRADSSADNTYMKNNLQEARWFLKSLISRNETLMKVATEIVELQRGFLDFGEEAMKPLVLADIAEAIGMHESTISRVTTQKYMHTPRGIFELKYFFSSHVSTESGGECSSTAIRAIIKKLVAAENLKKPLSDSKIANLLGEQGVKVARRTIAKYRESLHIPPSNERKRLV